MKSFLKRFFSLFSDAKYQTSSSRYDIQLVRYFLILYSIISAVSVVIGVIMDSSYIIILTSITTFLFSLGVFFTYRSENILFLRRWAIYIFETFIFAANLYVLIPVSPGHSIYYSPIFIFFLIFPIVAALFNLAIMKHVLFVVIHIILLQQYEFFKSLLPNLSYTDEAFHVVNIMAITSVLFQAFIFTFWIVKRNSMIYELENRHKKLYMELNDSKTKLFSIIAHDLKSPMSGIMGLTDLLLDKNMSEEDHIEITEALNKATYKYHDLLNELLTWSKSQISQITIHKESMRIEEIVKNVVENYREWIDTKKLFIDTKGVYPGEIYADRIQLESILRNFLSNAIKFTPTNGSIHIDSKFKDNTVIISVKDTGVGISEQVLNKLFDESNIYTTKGTEQEAGTGLGLKICQEFAARNNGRIWAESTPGQGSNFHLMLMRN